MQTLHYLNSKLLEGYDVEESLSKLNEEFAIKVNSDERFPTLYVLNYDQINSPKMHQITKECRSLVIEYKNTFKVVSRSFDRFFNYGEEPDKKYDITEMTAYEKVDGSLIGLFYTEDYGWLYRTRSMIMPEGSVNGWELTWKELIEEAVDWDKCQTELDKDFTYILEVVSPENRVVTRYEDKKAYLLTMRLKDGGYYDMDCHPVHHFNEPKRYTFDSFNKCAEAAKELRDLEEGYVLYNLASVPKVKIKNPAYVAAHHLLGEGLNPKRMMELILINEQDEYLSIFPEDKDKFEPYILAYKDLLNKIEFTYSCVKSLESQKEFALQIKDICYSAVLFQARAKDKEPLAVWNDQKDSYKMKVLQTYKELHDA